MSHPAPLPSLPLSLLKPVFSPPHHSHHHHHDHHHHRHRHHHHHHRHRHHYLNQLYHHNLCHHHYHHHHQHCHHHYCHNHTISTIITFLCLVDATVSHLWTLLPFSLSRHPYPYTSNQSLKPVDSATYISVISSSSLLSV